ncbi:DNA-binding helix-turn-helix protein [Enterococcus faecalis 13-SD-W-01]|nr:DNA-binding helix-turn-helix protein [Enterococcus faecalis 13-SD-W-01]
MNSFELGGKIRKFRNEKGISLEEICDDETRLTIRQLGRIERGEVNPSLEKLGFISERLGISITSLFEEKQELPRRYLELKDLLFKSPATHENKERASKKEEYFDEIYENYFYLLSKEEQLTIELKQIRLDVHMTKNINYCKPILEEYLEEVRDKEYLSLNDIMVIDLYFDYVYEIGYQEKEFNFFVDKLINFIPYAVDLELIVLDSAFTSACGVDNKYENYHRFIKYVEAGRKIMEKNFDYSSIPIWMVIEGKYYLFHEKNKQKAITLYEQAIKQAKFVNDIYLSEFLAEELNNDISYFEKKYI